MALRPGYKITDVGIIPSDWEVVPIGAAGAVIGGRQRSPHNVGPLSKYLRVANVFDGYISTEDVYEMPFTPEEKARFALRKDDILLNEGQSLELVGRSAIYHGDPPDCCFQNTLIRFRANPLVSTRFAQHIFQLYLHTGKFASIALQTTSIAHLGSGRFAALQMPLPSFGEQKAIAEALSDADALIESLEQLLAKKRLLKQGAMQELLTGKTRLPGFSGEWKNTRLGNMGLFLKGSGVKKSESLSGSLACVRYGELYTRHNNYINSFYSWISEDVALKATEVKHGDILFAGSGETKAEIGKCAANLHHVEAYAGGDIVILRPIDTDSIFLGYYLNTPIVNRQKAAMGQGDAVVHISSRALASIEVLVPPRAEQSSIASVLADIDTELVAIDAKLDKARHLKQAMMQELLTGRIRLL